MNKIDSINSITAYEEDLGKLAEYIWDNAELAFKEDKSSEALASFLEKEGFSVKRSEAGIKTAFSATFGSGKPVIGLLGEFDALQGLAPIPTELQSRRQESNIVSHGCGHNLLGVGSLGAALIVKDYLEKSGKPGTVIYFGCPGEEGGSGKTFMARDGVFDNLDAAITWHPASKNIVSTSAGLANVQIKYVFRGKSAHAASNPEDGRSALDALELMNIGVQFLREHMPDSCRIHYSIVDTGGLSPNVVQSNAAAIYLIRAKENSGVESLRKRVDNIAKGAALMTDTTVEPVFMKACSNFVVNNTLARLMQKNLEELPLPISTQEEDDFAAKINESIDKPFLVPDSVWNTLPVEERAEFFKKANTPICNIIYPLVGSHDGGGSTDVGDVSCICPTVEVNTGCWMSKSAGHSWQVATMSATKTAKKRTIYASKVMAGTIIDLLDNPKLIEEAKEEHKTNMGGSPYICPIPQGAKPQSIA